MPKTGEGTMCQNCTRTEQQQRTEPSELLEGGMEVDRGRISREHPNCDQNHVRGYGPIVCLGPQRGGPQRVSDLIGQEEDGHGEEENVS